LNESQILIKFKENLAFFDTEKEMLYEEVWLAF
jgi:hypothetical protein